MKVLTKADLLAATTLPTERVEIPELGGVVLVRGMSGEERDAYETAMFTRKGNRQQMDTSNFRAKLVASCCVDDAGDRLFTLEEAAQLGRVRADVLHRLWSVAQRLSGLGGEDTEEMGKSMPIPDHGDSGSSASRVN